MSGQQRLAMVADLLERAAVLVRRGDTFPVFGHAHSAVGRMMGGHPAEAEYRAILAMLDLAPADIDAAVAAILRGEPPPDSLVAAHAEVERLRALAREEWLHAREVADSEGVEPAERIAEALREIDGAPVDALAALPTPLASVNHSFARDGRAQVAFDWTATISHAVVVLPPAQARAIGRALIAAADDADTANGPTLEPA